MLDGPFPGSKRRSESYQEKALDPGTAYALNRLRDPQVVLIRWLAECHATSARFGVDCGTLVLLASRVYWAAFKAFSAA